MYVLSVYQHVYQYVGEGDPERDGGTVEGEREGSRGRKDRGGR